MTPSRLMRITLPSRLLRADHAALYVRVYATTPISSPKPPPSDRRHYARVEDVDKLDRSVWFTSTAPTLHLSPQPSDHKPPDQRTLQLGKTVRTLHERLPTLLQSPLPSEILSPQISLHLFPSTHPHLPTVSGRIAYVGALWTAPIAWGRMPLVGNVRLTILSERMVRNNGSASSNSYNGAGAALGTSSCRDEKLIVKWKTCGKTRHRDGTGGLYRGVGISAKDPVDRIKEFIAGTRERSRSTASPLEGRQDSPDDEEFCGIFVFEFDKSGRVVKHVIEHTEEGGQWERMNRVVSVTDWLLGQFNGKGKERLPELAWCERRRGDDVLHERVRRR